MKNNVTVTKPDFKKWAKNVINNNKIYSNNSLYTEDLITEALKQSYDQGHYYGIFKGYNNGYNKGHNEGFLKGQDAGEILRNLINITKGE